MHYHLEVQANPKKMAQKEPMLFLASMGETGLPREILRLRPRVSVQGVKSLGGHFLWGSRSKQRLVFLCLGVK